MSSAQIIEDFEDAAPDAAPACAPDVAAARAALRCLGYACFAVALYLAVRRERDVRKKKLA